MSKGKFLFGVGEIKSKEEYKEKYEETYGVSKFEKTRRVWERIYSGKINKESMFPYNITSCEISGKIKINLNDFENVYELLLFLNKDNMDIFKYKVYNHMNNIRRDIAEISGYINVNKKLLRAKKRELKLGEKYLNIE